MGPPATLGADAFGIEAGEWAESSTASRSLRALRNVQGNAGYLEAGRETRCIDLTRRGCRLRPLARLGAQWSAFVRIRIDEQVACL